MTFLPVEITGKGEAFITNGFNNRITCFLNASPLRPNSTRLFAGQVGLRKSTLGRLRILFEHDDLTYALNRTPGKREITSRELACLFHLQRDTNQG